MAHQWEKTSKTWDWDGTATENSLESVPVPRFMHRSDRMTIQETYDTSSGNDFLWRREVHYLDGSGDTYYISSVDVHLFRDSTTETLEQRREDGDWETQWVSDLTVNPPTGTFTYTTGFEWENNPGTRQFWETYSVNGAPGTSFLVGTFDVRDLRVQNIRSDKELFNPLEGGTTIKADIVALPAPDDSYLFPAGWSPIGSIPYRYEMERPPFSLPSGSGSVAQIPIVSATGKVAQISIPWNGKSLDGKYLNSPVKIEMKILADVAGPGNAFSKSDGSGHPFMRRCDDCLRSGELKLEFVMPLASQGIDPVLSYFSGLAGNSPSSFGYGWRSTSSATVTEDLDGAIIYKSESDIVMRWEPDGLGGYTAINGDNYSNVEKLGSGHFLITFPHQATREFVSGKLTSDADRNGNTVTYSYNGSGDLASVSDGRDRTVYYLYGSRTDGQPISVRSDDPATGREVQLEYYSSSHPNSPDRLAKIVDPVGDETEFEYEPNGPIKKIILKRPNKGDQVTEYFYNGSFRLSREVVNGELETLYTQMRFSLPYNPMLYDVMRIEIRDLTLAEPHMSPLRQTHYYYDPEGKLVRIEDGVPLILSS